MMRGIGKNDAQDHSKKGLKTIGADLGKVYIEPLAERTFARAHKQSERGMSQRYP
jgi:hypothetical protein